MRMRWERAGLAHTTRTIAALVAVVGLLALIPSVAGAASVNPPGLDFGSQRVGTTSPVQFSRRLTK